MLCSLFGGRPRWAGQAHRELADRAEADRVIVAPRQERWPRARAECRDVEAVVPQPTLGPPGVVRCIDRPAEGAGIAEACVVDQHRRTFAAPRRIDMPDQVPIAV